MSSGVVTGAERGGRKATAKLPGLEAVDGREYDGDVAEEGGVLSVGERRRG